MRQCESSFSHVDVDSTTFISGDKNRFEIMEDDDDSKSSPYSTICDNLGWFLMLIWKNMFKLRFFLLDSFSSF